VTRLDLIVGEVRGKASGARSNHNESARVLSRFGAESWTSNGDVYEVETTLPVTRRIYIRVRGTNTNELEPSMDRTGENPWADLWFYSNPIFIEIR
jgi:hypothetical protein